MSTYPVDSLLTEIDRIFSINVTAMKELADCLRRQETKVEGILSLLKSRLEVGGKLVFIGVGKSGQIALKLASTMTSIGNPSTFLHPTDAIHGDLGIVSENDVAIVFSKSFKSPELAPLVSKFFDWSVPVIGIGMNGTGDIAKKCQYYIELPNVTETCEHQLAPTTSTLMMLAIGDFLSVTLAKRRGFGLNDFARNHPGGSIGNRLSLRVSDLMKTGTDLPLVDPLSGLEKVVEIMTSTRHGGVFVIETRKVDVDGKPSQSTTEIAALLGLISERDLRSAFIKKDVFFKLKASDIMNTNPMTVKEDDAAFAAYQIMKEKRIQSMPVLTQSGHVVGVIRWHDIANRF